MVVITYRLFLLVAASGSVGLVEHVGLDSGGVDRIHTDATWTDGCREKVSKSRLYGITRKSNMIDIYVYIYIYKRNINLYILSFCILCIANSAITIC